MVRLPVDGRSLRWAFARLKAESPDRAQRAQRALEHLLSGVCNSPWPEVAWAFSRLTGDGFPVEFTFSTADSAIRYTAEVAGPEVPEKDRLSRAEALMVKLGAKPLPEELRTGLYRIQGSGPLLYGAWLGGRHDGTGDNYKLYGEVPEGDSPEKTRLVHSFLGDTPLLERPFSLRMMGYDPGSSRVELYFRAEALEPWEVKLLLRRAGLASRTEELFSLMEEGSRRSLAQVLGGKVGFSYSVALGRGAPVFSLFTFARRVYGGDGSIRRSLLELASRRGWNLENYGRLSEPLAKDDNWKTHHGMVAYIISDRGSPALHIGIRPPEVYEDAR